MGHTPHAAFPPPPAAKPRRFTVAEYHRMAEAGIIGRDERVELIEGEIIEMAPIGGPHIRAVNRLNRLLLRAVGDRAEVSVQSPVRLDDGTEPEPDMALLTPPADEYGGEMPTASEVLLLVEVASTNLGYDRARKRPLYARNGIPELWIVDLDTCTVEVCRNPAADGYASVETAAPGQTIGVLMLPGVEIPVACIVGRNA